MLGRIATWTDARLPLPAVIRAIALESHGCDREGLDALADRIEAGDPIDQAFAATESRFRGPLRRQLRAACQSGGDLRAALPALATLKAAQQRMRRQLFVTLTYPLCVLAILAVVIVFICWFIVPNFEEIFTEFGLTLPVLTTFFIEVSHHLPGLIGLIAGGVGALFLAGLVPGLSRYAHWLATSLPLFGRLWTAEGHYAFAELLGAYTATRLPAPQALRSVGAGLFDRNLARAALRAADRCEAGQTLGEAVGGSIHFEGELAAMIADGEARGDLPAALREAADVYNDSRRNQVTFLVSVIPPILIISIGLFVVVMVSALFLPLIQLIQSLT